MKNGKKKIRAVIHDWDDTIVNTFEPIYKEVVRFAKQENLRVPTMDELKLQWNKPWQKVVEELWRGEHSYRPDELLQRYRDSFPKDRVLEPIPGAYEALTNLKNTEYFLGVVSGSRRPPIDRVIDKHFPGIKGAHSIIHTADDSPFHKPDPRVFDSVINRISERGIETSEAIYVGDSLVDFYAARDRGFGFIAVTTGFTTHDMFLGEGLDEKKILKSFRDLPDLLL